PCNSVQAVTRSARSKSKTSATESAGDAVAASGAALPPGAAERVLDVLAMICSGSRRPHAACYPGKPDAWTGLTDTHARSCSAVQSEVPLSRTETRLPVKDNFCPRILIRTPPANPCYTASMVTQVTTHTML